MSSSQRNKLSLSLSTKNGEKQKKISTFFSAKSDAQSISKNAMTSKCEDSTETSSEDGDGFSFMGCNPITPKVSKLSRKYRYLYCIGL